MRDLTKLAAALLLLLAAAQPVVAHVVGDIVDMGAAKPSAPRGCELMGFGGSGYDESMKADGSEEFSTFYWFGCPSAARPRQMVLWRVRDIHLVGELRLSQSVLSAARYRLGSGKIDYALVLGACFVKGDLHRRINALVPVGYEAQEGVPIGRVALAWRSSSPDLRIAPVPKAALRKCHAG